MSAIKAVDRNGVKPRDLATVNDFIAWIQYQYIINNNGIIQGEFVPRCYDIPINRQLSLTTRRSLPRRRNINQQQLQNICVEERSNYNNNKEAYYCLSLMKIENTFYSGTITKTITDYVNFFN